ncbi:MAG: hypothetical protein JOZ65_20340 [Chloroflexi bacterium]|nr:hypothetical protein [Chloroflexota bacterium]
MTTDPVLARQLDAMLFMLVGFALVGLALYLRLRIFIGKRPGGVDTWYYLASAEAIRKRKWLPISLPQYLLHDETESYPAVFPIFLALLPERWRKSYFWLISPLIDAIQLLLLYLLTFRLTDSVLAAGTAGLIYAVTPQLISETRNLNGRAFASLLQTLCMLVLLRSIIPSDGPSANITGPHDYGLWAIGVLLVAVLYNTHTSTTIAFLVSAATLSVVFGERRLIVAGLAGLPLAVIMSGGYYLRVIRNHVYAAQFWLENVQFTRAHQVNDSPLFSIHNGSGRPHRQHGLYRSSLSLFIRVIGENPFILPVLVTPIPANVWAAHMYWWAVAVLALSVLTTFGGPLRILGPGYHYMKTSVFPTAYVLSVTVNIQEGAISWVGLALVISVIASFAALAYFYRVMTARETEHTAQTPPDLAEAAAYLGTLPGERVLVLPTMYADFVAYGSHKAVVWGGHSGNLKKFAEFYPVLRRPIEYFVRRYNVDYILLDEAYVQPVRLGIAADLSQVRRFGAMAIYEFVRPAATLQPDLTTL